MTCKQCDGGWLMTQEGMKSCDCLRLKNIEKFYKWSEGDPKYNVSFDELSDQQVFNGKKEKQNYKDIISDLTESREKIEYMIENEFRIVLRGTTGTGKTQMAVSIAKEILGNVNLNVDTKMNKFFFLSSYEIKDIVFNFDQDGKDRLNNIMEKVKKAKVLIIDDLGVELQCSDKQKEHILSRLTQLVRSFTGIIIMTTNLEEEISEKYREESERLVSSLLPSNVTKDRHGEFNALFYTLKLKNDRRLKRNQHFSFK